MAKYMSSPGLKKRSPAQQRAWWRFFLKGSLGRIISLLDMLLEHELSNFQYPGSESSLSEALDSIRKVQAWEFHPKYQERK
jgi:hypothetical protein